MVQRTTKAAARKAACNRPKSTYKDFLLWAHVLGYCAKRIKGKIHYFGRWGRIVGGKMTPLPYEFAWQEALKIYKKKVDYIQAGPTLPAQPVEKLTLAQLCNQFLTAKQNALNSSELSQRMFDEYQQTTDRLIAVFGPLRTVPSLRPADFDSLRVELAAQYGPVRLGNEVQKVRTLFK